jgi:hypothetical protein
MGEIWQGRGAKTRPEGAGVKAADFDRRIPNAWDEERTTMKGIVHQTLSRKRTDQLLGSFEIVPCQNYQPGRPYQQTRLVACAQLRSDEKFCDRLKSYRNWNGHWYNERHVEEWVARTPAWLFPNQAVHVLASQNYAHLGGKIDLLLLDDRNQFHVVEIKAERVASNRGVTPDEIEGQMSR